MVIVSRDKLVDTLSPPVPLEVLGFRLAATLRALGQTAVRPHAMASPDGGVIADYHGRIGDPSELAVRLGSLPGVLDHGLFPPELVADVIVGDARRERGTG